MPETTLPLIKGDKVTKNVDFGDAIPVNVSGIVQPILGSSGFMLQEPGLTHYAEGVGMDRGGIWNERMGKHFRVSGGSLISISKTGVVTDLGDLPGTDNVSLPYSFISQGIIAGGGFFLWNGDVLTQVGTGASADTGFAIGVPIDGVWVDGYYFLTDGEYLYHTQLANESAINPLAFATSEYSPDPTIGLGLTNDNKVIAFNRFSVEYFVNQATENFAFTRLPSRTIKYGLVGTHAKCEIGGNYFFLGGPKEGSVSVYALGTGEVQDLGSREANKIINKYNEEHLATAVLEARVIDDYQYLILHLPEDCIMINLKIAKELGKEYAWSILKTDVLGNTPWRAIHGIFDPQIGQYVYGDQWDERIGILDMSVATQYNEVVECILYTPFMYLESMSIDQLEIFIIPGFTTPNYPRVVPPPVPPPVIEGVAVVFSLLDQPTGPNIVAYLWNETEGFVNRYLATHYWGPGNGGDVLFSPQGGAVLMVLSSDPYVYAYIWDEGFGLYSPYDPPSEPLPVQMYALAFSPEGAAVAFAGGGGFFPQIYVYRWNDISGFGEKFTFSETASVPATCVEFSPSGKAICYGHGTGSSGPSEGVSVYKWSDTAGFGTKFAGPSPAVSGYVTSVAFSPSGKAVIFLLNGSPYITAYAWDDVTGFGAQYSAPETALIAHCDDIDFSPLGDSILLASDNTASLIAYGWDDVLGFGDQFTSPSPAPPSGGYAASFSPSGTNIVLACSSTPYTAGYGWNDGVGFGAQLESPGYSLEGPTRGLAFKSEVVS